MSNLSFSRIGLTLGLLATSMTHADAPSTAPAMAADSDGATTAPAAMFDGYLAPVDPFEARLEPKTFAGPFKIKSVVPHGTEVKAGDVLVQFDSSELEDAILAATSELELAKAQAAKQAIDNTLAEQNDAQALAVATDTVSDAQLALEWWDKIESPNYLKTLDLEQKQAEYSVGDQEDELDQLRKMYKSEELTNATADIVVRRAVRGLERSKTILEMTRGDVERRKATEFVDKKQELDRNLFNARQALEAVKAQQELSKVERAAATAKSKAAVKEAQKKLNELEEDKTSLAVKSKIDGVAFYGSFADGSWTGSKPEALRADKKVDLSGPLMTVIAPGKLKAVVKVDEAKVFEMKQGDAVTLRPAAIDGLAVDGKVGAVDLLAGDGDSYPMSIDLGSVDTRLVPGMKVKAEIGEGK